MVKHERQHYDRSDVSQPSRKRTIVALAVLVVLVVVSVGGARFLWNQAQEDTTLGDTELSAAVEETESVESSTTYDRSDAEFTNVLFVVVEDVEATSLTLSSAQLACLNPSASQGYLVLLPNDMLTSEGTSLSDVVVQEGSAAAVSAVAETCQMSINHVLVMDQEGYDELLDIASSGSSDLLSSASTLLDSLTTDMDVSQLVSLAETLQGIGVGNLSILEAPLTQDGTTVDPDQLGIFVGYLTSS